MAWLHCNKLLINTTKTKMTIFHTPHREVIYPEIKINNTSVEIVGEFKFLGIFIIKVVNSYEFRPNKILKYIGVINRLKHTLPPRVLLTLYNTLILPHLNYGLVLWGHRNERISSLKKGQFVQFLILNLMGTQNQYINYSAYLNCQTCITFSFIRCITKSKEKLSHNILLQSFLR